MFPDLSYFLNYIFGSSIDNGAAIFKTFGLFLILTFIVSAYIITLELKRKEKEGLIFALEEDNPELKGNGWKDLITNTLIAAFLGFKLPYIIDNFEALKRNPSDVIFSANGNIMYGIIVGALTAGLLYLSIKKEKEQDKSKLPKKVLVHPYQRVGEIIMLAAVFGIIGSRLFSILENFSDFIQDPIGQIVSGSGLTIYGGLILAFLVIYFYAGRKGIKPIHMMDIAAPALILGYGVGRMGCQFSGDGDWGIVNKLSKPSWFPFPDWTWSNHYPRNVLNQGTLIPDCVGNYCHQLVPGVFPTPIYEIIYSIIGFAIIWSLRKRIKTPGIIFFIYLLLTGIGRFFVEFIRVNPRYNYFGFDLSQAQYIAMAFILIAITGLFYLGRKKQPAKVPS